MPRRVRLHLSGGFYHVTLRGNHRRTIFLRESDRRLMNGLVATALGATNAALHAYCWMSNHIHMLIQVADAPLDRVMRRIASRYARLIHQRLDTTGHLFERRYDAQLVDTDTYLLEVIRYIHLNPVRAGLVADPDDYAYSSHQVYLGVRVEPWVTTRFALAMLGRDKVRAVRSYRQFIDAGLVRPPTRKDIAPNPEDGRVLGDDAFRIRCVGTAARVRPTVTLPQLVDDACQRFSIARDALVSKGKARRLTEARLWIARHAMEGQVASLAAIARALGRDESSIRKGLSRHADRPLVATAVKPKCPNARTGTRGGTRGKQAPE